MRVGIPIFSVYGADITHYGAKKLFCHPSPSLYCPFGLFPILLKGSSKILRVDLLHVSKCLTVHQLLRRRNILFHASVHKLSPLLLYAGHALQQFAVRVRDHGKQRIACD